MRPEQLAAWFASRVPEDWFTGPPEVMADGEEILVLGDLPDVEVVKGSEAARDDARRGRIVRFRQESRERRMAIATEGERRYRPWRAYDQQRPRIGKLPPRFLVGSQQPDEVLARLHRPDREQERAIDAEPGQHSRCGSRVGRHQGDWIETLREALTQVEEARRQGPS